MSIVVSGTGVEVLGVVTRTTASEPAGTLLYSDLNMSAQGGSKSAYVVKP